MKFQQILTANDVCSALLGRPEEELCGGQTKLKDFLSLHSLDLLHQSPPLISASDISQNLSPLPTPSSVLQNSSVQFEDTKDCCSITEDHDTHIINTVEPLVSLSVPGEITELKASADNKDALLTADDKCKNSEDPVDHSSISQCLKKPPEEQQIVSGSEGKCVSSSSIASTPTAVSDVPTTPTHHSPGHPFSLTDQSSDTPQLPVLSDSDSTPVAVPESWTQSDILQGAEVLKKEGQVLYSGKVVSEHFCHICKFLGDKSAISNIH